jgi:hypothetical protein
MSINSRPRRSAKRDGGRPWREREQHEAGNSEMLVRKRWKTAMAQVLQ